MPERVRPVRPPKTDPFDEVPVFDPAQPDNPPPPPGSASTALTVSTAPQDADACRDRLRELAREIVVASPARGRAILQEVARLRVALQLHEEADSKASDPDTYRELSLLNRMLAGEEELDPTTDEARLAEAEAILATRGVDPARARRIMRTLDSLLAVPEPEHDDAARRRKPAH